MKLVIFGLSISSSWGNGHATLWRGLIRALIRHGHGVSFYERDVEYYALNRDCWTIEGGSLILYSDWPSVRRQAEAEVRNADAVIVTSYCPDALPAGQLALDAALPLRVFYDLDTPVTLDRLRTGAEVPYIGPRGLADYDLVLSYTGGQALEDLVTELGARRTAPLYGSVDPDRHRPAAPADWARAGLSYLGTFAADRQATLERLFIEPARRLPARRFLLGGAGYPADFPWTDNIYFVRHLPPGEHPTFFSSCRLTLNVTRAAMAACGWCPSGRLFEAAACGAPLVTDRWAGIEQFFAPGREILVADDAPDVIAALALGDAELAALARAARERVLAEHTATHRALELERLLEAALSAAAAPEALAGAAPSRAEAG